MLHHHQRTGEYYSPNIKLAACKMTNVISIVSQVGASSSLISDLQALQANTSLDGKPIYSKGYINWLASVITGRVENEKNKDMPLFHLCHLASSIAAISGPISL